MNLIQKKLSFLPHIKEFEKALKEDIETFGNSTKLKSALEYSLLSGGKRLRPLIVYLVAEALGKNYDVHYLALSVEYFHTASLIADDLPCMDNDEVRRDKPTLHVVFGETTALLASYALISAAFEKIFQGSMIFSKHCSYHEKACTLALKEASFASGIHGATGGQHLDLFPESLNLRLLEEIIEKKTITLFNVSFLFGWIFGGGDLSKIDTVKSAAYDFGMAFQIADDMQDMAQDKEKEHVANMALLLGYEEAFNRVKSYLENFKKSLSTLGIESPLFDKIVHKVLKHACS